MVVENKFTPRSAAKQPCTLTISFVSSSSTIKITFQCVWPTFFWQSHCLLTNPYIKGKNSVPTLHCFSPYYMGKACPRDSVSHSCNSLIIREKLCTPTLFWHHSTLFSILQEEESLLKGYWHYTTLFSVIRKTTEQYTYTLECQSLL